MVLRYRAKNGLRFFEDHDELYWNVTGDEWDVPIGAASARIELPAGATGVRAIAFNGAYGSTAQDAEVIIEGTAVRVTMPQPLGFHEGLTAVVGWDKGLVAEPTTTDRALGFLASNWPLGIPLRRAARACSPSGGGWAAIPDGCRSRCSTSRRTRSRRRKPAR